MSNEEDLKKQLEEQKHQIEKLKLEKELAETKEELAKVNSGNTLGKDNIFTKKELKKIEDRINSLRMLKYAIKSAQDKEDFDDAIDECEKKFKSVYVPGLWYFEIIVGTICLLGGLLGASAGYAAGGVGSAIGYFIGVLIITYLVLWLYTLPTWLALRNGHKSAWLIAVINVLFGLTLIPWIFTLFWALSNQKNKDRLTKEQSDMIRNEIIPMIEKLENKLELLKNKNENSTENKKGNE